jgi:hypothetical protein
MTAARVVLAAVVVAGLALVAGGYLLVVHQVVAAGVLGGVFIVGLVAAMILSRKADPAELEAIAARHQQSAENWARSVGRASGGWDPKRPKRKD